jgi:hypothetical protein
MMRILRRVANTEQGEFRQRDHSPTSVSVHPTRIQLARRNPRVSQSLMEQEKKKSWKFEAGVLFKKMVELDFIALGQVWEHS